VVVVVMQDTLIWRGSLSVAGGIFSADRVRYRDTGA
jgi:hypothetical protein